MMGGMRDKDAGKLLKSTVLSGLALLLLGAGAYGLASAWLGADTPQPVIEAATDTALPAPVITTRPAPADINIMTPHRAVYRMELVEKRSSAHILNISGQMFFQWRSVCDAWATDHRFRILYEYPDAPAMQVQSDFTTYEAHNGESFDFSARRRRNGELYDDIRGHAAMPASDNNKGGHARFTAPEGTAFDLPPGTLFPMAHTLAMTRAVRDGDHEGGGRFAPAIVFDGSDDQGPVEANAILGPAVMGIADRFAGIDGLDTNLLSPPARSIRMAFFTLYNTESGPDSDYEMPDYEMEVTLHENGIISDMRVEYRDFTVTQTLTALEQLDSEPCAAPVDDEL